MDILDPETVVVYNHSDLNSAVSSDNGYIFVHLGADFAITGGIRIYPGKPRLVIDGVDPRDPAGTVHTLTDRDSSVDTGGLYLNAASSIQIVFQNLNMVGRNYYGMPCIFDIAANAAVSVSYNHITYEGPQLIWNPRGLTRFIDCDITIQQGYSPPQEVGEVNRVEIGGTTVIRHNNTTTSNSAFLFYNRSGSSLTFLEGADVNISTVNSFFTAETAMPATLQPGARLALTTRRGISVGAGSTFNRLHLQQDSVFHYTRLSNAANVNALFMTGPVILDQGADLLMMEDVPGATGALIYCAAGTRIELNSPKRFALYNSGTSTSARPFYFGAQTGFRFTGNQVDYWKAATPTPVAGTFDDKAPWRWYRPEWGIFELSGTATSITTTITGTSLTQEEQDALPALTEMQLHLAKVFAVGVLPLTVNRVVGDKRPVTGTSLPSSDIRVDYKIDTLERRYTGSCGSTGGYSVPVEDTMPANTSVAVASNIQFLLTEVTALAADAGELDIVEAPTLIEIAFNPISQNPVILPRVIPGAPVVISDERVDVDRTQWVLWAKIDGPLRTNSGLTLPSSVVFVRKGETALITLSETYTAVHTDGPYDDVQFPIVWGNAEGVLARITAPIRVHEVYSALLTWAVLPIGVDPESGLGIAPGEE